MKLVAALTLEFGPRPAVLCSRLLEMYGHKCTFPKQGQGPWISTVADTTQHLASIHKSSIHYFPLTRGLRLHQDTYSFLDNYGDNKFHLHLTKNIVLKPLLKVVFVWIKEKVEQSQ